MSPSTLGFAVGQLAERIAAKLGRPYFATSRVQHFIQTSGIRADGRAGIAYLYAPVTAAKIVDILVARERKREAAAAKREAAHAG